MKHLLFLLLLGGSIATKGVCQERAQGATISGTVADSISHEPQPFATIRLLTTAGNKQAVSVAAADAHGHFTLTAPQAGEWTLEAVATGSTPAQRRVHTVAGQPTLVDTLWMQPASTLLGTATVTAQKVLVKADLDKLTYDLQSDPEAASASTLDMLRKVPMVTVDGEDKIKVNGNSQFKVYVNGKPNQMMSANPSEILKAYPAAAIERIEVITSPGAKYDAEGVAGILNIITRSNSRTSGFTLTPSVAVSNQFVREGVMGMVQWGKWTMAVNYGAVQQFMQQMVANQVLTNALNPESYRVTKLSDLNKGGKGSFQYGSVEMGYEASPKDLINISANWHSWRANTPALTTATATNAAGALTYGYHLGERNKQGRTMADGALDYQHTFKEQQTLTASYRLSYSPGWQRRNLLYEELTGHAEQLNLMDIDANTDQTNTEHTAQMDFATPVGEHHSLRAGLKYINRLNRSDNVERERATGATDYFTLNPISSVDFKHRSHIAAAYTEYAYKRGKTALQGGLRYEWTHIRGTYADGRCPDFTSHASDWVPTLSLGYNFTPTTLLKAGYSLRIGRPDITYLTPYVRPDSPESDTYGNPNLGSEHSHQCDVTFSRFTQKTMLSAALTYAFSNNGLMPYAFWQEGKLHNTFGNLVHRKQLSLAVNGNFTLAGGTSVNFNGTGGYVDYRATLPAGGQQQAGRNKGWNASLFGGVTQRLPWKLQASLWAGGGSRTLNLQGSQGGYYFYSLNLRRSFLQEDRLTVNAFAGNFIKPHRHFRNVTETEAYSLTQDVRINFLRVGLGISYRLGSLRAQVKKTSHTIENNDVMKQSGQGGTQQPGGME